MALHSEHEATLIYRKETFIVKDIYAASALIRSGVLHSTNKMESKWAEELLNIPEVATHEFNAFGVIGIRQRPSTPAYEPRRLSLRLQH
jgi:hypothetical protein